MASLKEVIEHEARSIEAVLGASTDEYLTPSVRVQSARESLDTLIQHECGTYCGGGKECLTAWKSFQEGRLQLFYSATREFFIPTYYVSKGWIDPVVIDKYIHEEDDAIATTW